MSDGKTLGKLGEEFAAKLLEERGYQILIRNFSCKYGEIDLIVKKNMRISFVEVKTRKGDSFGQPAEAVDKRKQYRIKNAANYYLNRTKWKYDSVDFQVIEITVNQIEELVF